MFLFFVVLFSIILFISIIVFSSVNNENENNNYNFDDKYFREEDRKEKDNDIDVSDYVTIELRHGSKILHSNKDSKKREYKKTLRQTNVKKDNYKNKVVFVDTETTGLSNNDEFIEVTAILGEFDKQGNIEILDEYTGLRNPGVEIHPKAREVHKISDEELIDAELNYDKLNSIFNKAHFVTAHNASFDRKFLIKEFDQLKNKFWICSMNGVKWEKRGFKSKGLQNLLEDHDIKVDNSHRTRDDVIAMIKLLNCKASPRTTYFNQLLRNNKIKQKSIIFN